MYIQNFFHILAVSYFNGAKPAYSKRPVLSKLIVNTNEDKTHGLFVLMIEYIMVIKQS